MKLSYARHGATGARELLVRLGRRESWDRASVRLLSAGLDEVFVPLCREHAGPGAERELRYDVSGLRCLRECLRTRDGRQFPLYDAEQDLLLALDSRPRLCGAGVRPQLLCDARYVYVCAEGRLRFVLVPLSAPLPERMASPLGLLNDLLTRRGGRRHPQEDEEAMALREFVLGAEGTFSLNRYRGFVEDMRGRERSPNEDGKRTTPILVDETTGEEHRLSEGREYVLGRSPSCDVPLTTYPKISRVHASIRCTALDVLLTDRSSTNGTFVLGRRLGANSDEHVSFDQRFLLSDRPFYVRRG